MGGRGWFDGQGGEIQTGFGRGEKEGMSGAHIYVYDEGRRGEKQNG